MAENPAALSKAVQRALSEALTSVHRQLKDVQSSFEQVKEALEAAGEKESADRFVALLPPLMHMQAAGAALAASIETVLRFVGVSAQWTGIPAMAMPAAAPARAAAPAAVEEEAPPAARPAPVEEEERAPAPVAEAPPPARPAPAEAVDIDSLPEELKALHKKAKRFAKVTVQELALYKKDEVTKGRENKDLYRRFQEEIDRSKALYDERFRKIADHNIDYLYDELVRVLAENDPSALGDYPYRPSSSRG